MWPMPRLLACSAARSGPGFRIHHRPPTTRTARRAARPTPPRSQRHGGPEGRAEGSAFMCGPAVCDGSGEPSYTVAYLFSGVGTGSLSEVVTSVVWVWDRSTLVDWPPISMVSSPLRSSLELDFWTRPLSGSNLMV